MNVTQVASRPPSVPASIGESAPGSRKAAMKPTNWSTMISGPGVVSAIPRPSSISPGLQPAVVLDGLLRHIGQYGVGPAERDHRHLGEEHGDLAEHIADAKQHKQGDDRREPQREPHGGHAQALGDARARVVGQILAKQAIGVAAAFSGGPCPPPTWNAGRPARPPR